MAAVSTHPEFLADEDCEQVWVRYDLATDDVAALAYVASTLGLDTDEMDGYECYGTVRMRQATMDDLESREWLSPQQIDEGWYFPCRDDEPGDETYWSVKA